MLVLGFKYFHFKSNSRMNDINNLVGSILAYKFNREEVVDASKMFKVLMKKEACQKQLMEREKEAEKKRDRKAQDKMNKDVYLKHIKESAKAFHKH